jgi:hypothetical protein
MVFLTVADGMSCRLAGKFSMGSTLPSGYETNYCLFCPSIQSKSDWVEDEVTKAFEEERKRKPIVLFPIRLER